MKRQIIRGLCAALPVLSAVMLAGCGTCPAGASEEAGTLVIANDPRALGTLYYLYVAPSDACGWGRDLLGSGVLRPAGERVINVDDWDRRYDIRAEYDHGPAVEKRGVRLACCATTRVTFSD